MNAALKASLLKVYRDSLQPPFMGGFQAWAEQNIILPPAYAIPGKVDLSISPHLLMPAEYLTDPRIFQINLCMATQVGKSFLSEMFIPFVSVTAPGPMMRIFHDQAVSDIFTTDRLVPLMKMCPPIIPLLKFDRFSTGKSGISMPHMAVTCGSSNTALAHGMSIKYLLMDELHQWEPGKFQKFLARTTAFSGRRKIICASQPARTGHEWESICFSGMVWDWQWLCPKCNIRQPFQWSKAKPDDKGYAGFNWDSVLLPDGTTDIAKSSLTTYMECEHCDGRIYDTPAERLYLNQTGKYVCIKNDGNPGVATFTCPCWVNVNISFASKAAEFMIAKRTKKLTGLDELLEIFFEQSLGKFYKRDEEADVSKILTEVYDKKYLNRDWYLVMGVDVQRTGGIKYYVVRAWNRNGNESRRVAFGIALNFTEIDEIAKKHNVPLPLVHVDSGDGTMTQEIYQQCLTHGMAVKLKEGLQYVSWTPTKGDQKLSYKHKDNITRLYSEVSNQDSGFPTGHKLKGIPAPLVLFSNFSLKTLLTQLRDNFLPGIKWLIDYPDTEYDAQMYSEGLQDVVDKRSGLITKRWMATRQANHFFDCEVLCLLGAIRANAFSAVKINEDDIRKLINDAEKGKSA